MTADSSSHYHLTRISPRAGDSLPNGLIAPVLVVPVLAEVRWSTVS